VIRRRILRIAGMGESDVEQIVAPVYKTFTNPRTTIRAAPPRWSSSSSRRPPRKPRRKSAWRRWPRAARRDPRPHPFRGRPAATRWWPRCSRRASSSWPGRIVHGRDAGLAPHVGAGRQRVLRARLRHLQ
jgi:hypothetical protein